MSKCKKNKKNIEVKLVDVHNATVNEKYKLDVFTHAVYILIKWKEISLKILTVACLVFVVMVHLMLWEHSLTRKY